MEDTNLNEVPLYVDLDGTYTKTDLLFESFVAAFKKNPLIVLKCLYWLMQSISALKYNLSKYAEINTNSLPLNQEFLSFLEQEKQNGRKLYLATASNEKYAKAIVNNSNLFDGYISSCKKVNLKGKSKLKKIKEVSERFAYAGNDSVDFDIFQEATESILVNPSKSAIKKTKKHTVNKVFDNNTISSKTWLKQLRIHQWLKNLLIFVPLIVSGGFTYLNNVAISLIAFVAFGLLASSTYILNDLLDLESDRLHPRKRNRPLAAGSISIKSAIFA